MWPSLFSFQYFHLILCALSSTKRGIILKLLQIKNHLVIASKPVEIEVVLANLKKKYLLIKTKQVICETSAATYRLMEHYLLSHIIAICRRLVMGFTFNKTKFHLLGVFLKHLIQENGSAAQNRRPL